jgi:hypothetical protein
LYAYINLLFTIIVLRVSKYEKFEEHNIGYFKKC